MTPETFRQACDRFFYVENLKPPADTDNGNVALDAPDTPDTPDEHAPENGSDTGKGADNKDKSAVPTMRQALDAGIRNTLNKAVKNCTDEATGWAFVGQIGIYLSQTLPDFDTRTYGYSQLSKMLKALGGLQFRHDEASRMFCRKIPYGELIKLLTIKAIIRIIIFKYIFKILVTNKN